MKIIQLIYSLSSGGAERFVVDLSNELASKGHDVTICMLLDDSIQKLSFNKQFIADNVNFHSLRFNSGFSLSKIKKVESYILSQTPDIVHCHLNVIPYIYRLSYRNRQIKFLHTLHNIAKKTYGHRLQYYINRYFYQNDIIRPVTISKQCQCSYLKLYKLDNAPYIDNGRAPIEPTFKIQEVRDEIQSYKKTKNSPVFIHIGRYNSQKNQQLLIDVFNKLNSAGYDYILLVIGTGFDSNSGLKLKEIANCRIFFLGEKNNVGDYLLCSDAFCLTSIFEGLPISLLEALSCGVTPICTNVGGIADVIEDNITGYLSEVQMNAYYNAILKFFSHKLDKDKLIKYFNENYSIAHCADKYIALYKK